MAWYDTLFKVDPTGGWGLSNLNTTAKVLGGTLGAAGLAKLVGNSNSVQEFLGIGGANTNQPVGYQGGIPNYTATRTQLPIAADPTRRPGAGGRRYFGDLTYTAAPPVPSATAAPAPGMSNEELSQVLTGLIGAQEDNWGANVGTTNTGGAGTTNTGGAGTTNTGGAGTTPTGGTKTTTTTTTTPTVTNLDITNWLKANPKATDTQIAQVMNQYKVTPQQVAAATNTPIEQVTQRYNDAMLKTPAGLPTDIKNVADVANYAKAAAADKSFTSGETGSLLNMAINLNLSPTKMAEMLGVTAGDVVSHLRATMPTLSSDYLKQYGYAKGGLASLPQSRGYYLGGATDGMADKVPARIDNTQEARLSDGEFVLPADIVSHLGNGNSQAGAKVLYDMMDRVRRARTGRVDQGRQINPDKYTPV